MPTFAVIGDVHARTRYLEPVLARAKEADVDAILLVGDLGSHELGRAAQRTPARDARYLSSVAQVLDRVRALGRPVAYVPGNHDLPTLSFPGNVDRTVVEIAGLRVAGIGGAGPDRFGFAYEWTDAELRARTLPKCDVILAHCPPARTALDHVPRGDRHVGSEAIREICERHTGFLVCGHIHESPGACQIGACLCLNAGGLGRPFGLPQIGFLRREGGVDEVIHEDLLTGAVRRWRRETA